MADQPHVTIPGISAPPRSDSLRFWARLACIAVVACAGLYLTDRLRSRATDRQLADRVASLTVQINAEEAKQRQEQSRIDSFIRQQLALTGMTAREVTQAKGQPRRILRNADLFEEARWIGAVEGWVYGTEDSPNVVLYGTKGLVLYATDSKGRMAEFVRQDD